MKMTLKALRANKNLSQKEVAKALNISKETWRNYELGKTFPDVPTIQKMEKFFEVKYDDIIFLPCRTIKS